MRYDTKNIWCAQRNSQLSLLKQRELLMPKSNMLLCVTVWGLRSFSVSFFHRMGELREEIDALTAAHVREFWICCVQVWAAVSIPDGRIWPASEIVRMAGRTASGTRRFCAWRNQFDPVWSESRDAGWTTHDENAWCRCRWSVLHTIYYLHLLCHCHFPIKPGLVHFQLTLASEDLPLASSVFY